MQRYYFILLLLENVFSTTFHVTYMVADRHYNTRNETGLQPTIEAGS